MKRTITATAEITIIVDNADEAIKMVENVETAEDVKARWAYMIRGELLAKTNFDFIGHDAKTDVDVKVNPAKVKSFEMED